MTASTSTQPHGDYAAQPTSIATGQPTQAERLQCQTWLEANATHDIPFTAAFELWIGAKQQLAADLAPIIALAKLFVAEQGGCDHSVDVCSCQDRHTINDANAVLANLGIGEDKVADEPIMPWSELNPATAQEIYCALYGASTAPQGVRELTPQALRDTWMCLRFNTTGQAARARAALAELERMVATATPAKEGE